MHLHEESPCSKGQRCWITSSGGDPKESATERYRQSPYLAFARFVAKIALGYSGKGGKVR